MRAKILNILNISQRGFLIMTRTGIECFLSICRHKTISHAAEKLFITQSSLSIRLKTLESELGGKLFYRKKGTREISLTAAGKEFYKLAIQYEALEEEMRSVFKKQSKVLRISSFNSLGACLLPEVFELFLERYPNVHLNLQDMDIDAAYRHIQDGLTDIAFTASISVDEKFRRIPLFREPMVLLAGRNLAFSSPVTPDTLPLESEIFVDWTPVFTHWHEETFPDARPQITISLMSHLHRFLENGSSWAIIPESVAETLLSECNAERIETAFVLPEREISLVVSPDYYDPILSCLCECIGDIIKKHNTLKSLLD